MSIVYPPAGCPHDIITQEVGLADGYCPLCLAEEVRAWRECAQYDPDMSGKGRFKGWNRSALDRCRKQYIQKED